MKKNSLFCYSNLLKYVCRNVQLLFVLATTLFTIIFACAFTEGQKIYDQAKLLTAEQITTLEAKALSIAKEKSVDIIIVTTADANDKTAQQYADDFYDEHKFGYEHENGSGVLFLIDMDNREAYISTAGTAITYFTDERINLALDSIFEFIPNGQYYEACNAFIDKVSEYIGNPSADSNVYYDSNGNSHSNSDGYVDSSGNYTQYTPIERFKQNAWIYLIISIITGIVGAAMMAANSGGKITVGSSTYIDKSSIHVNHSQDQFIRTTVTKRKIETNSGGGGSSTHTSSGGHTHGGGGRSF